MSADTESHASWTRAKKKWLRIVDELVAALPQPEVASKEECDELKAQLSDAEQALVDAEHEVAELKETVERLKAAKDATEVAEILLPKGDIERFEELRKTAADALREVPLVVREAIRCRLAGKEMRWADPVRTAGL